jgi:hypothetical protein
MHTLLENENVQAGIGLVILAGASVLAAWIRNLWSGGTVNIAQAKAAGAAEAQRQMDAAVLAVEEKAAVAIKSGLDGFTSADKRAAAKEAFRELGGNLFLPTDALLHAAVAKLPGVGAIGYPRAPAADPLRERVAD